MAVTLWAARHAPVEALGVCYGRADLPARMAPEELALRLSLALEKASVTPDAIWSSPLTRCLQPAEELAARLGRPFRVDARLLEMDFGVWEGRRWDDLEQEDGVRLRAWMDDWKRSRPGGGETLGELESRVRAWRHALDAETAMLVAHAGVIRALRVLGGAEWDEAMRTPVPHGRLEQLF